MGQLIGQWMIFFFSIVGFVLLNFILAELAGRWFGNMWIWLLAFFLLPGISHFMLIVVFVYHRRKMGELKVLKAVIDDRSGIRRLIDQKTSSEMNPVSVTPFAQSVKDSGDKSAESPKSILDELSDEEIDKLINWGEWGKAFSMASERLDSAREKGDDDSVRLYEAYMEVIRPRIGLGF